MGASRPKAQTKTIKAVVTIFIGVRSDCTPEAAWQAHPLLESLVWCGIRVIFTILQQASHETGRSILIDAEA
jgi:hypothetical protein